MRLVFSNPFHFTNTTQRFIRLVVVSVTFIITLYYTAYLYIAVPFFGFDVTWKPDNVLTVIDISSNRNSGSFFQVGDQILTIDGYPAYQNIWQPLYSPGRSAYTYTIQREGEVHIFEIPVETGNPEITLEALERSLTGLVALSFWMVGALIILFATPSNGEAWFLGFVTLTTAVVLAASEAALYNVPSAWLLSNPFYPFVGVLLVRLAFLPQVKPLSSLLQSIFRGLYVLAIVLGLMALFELLYLVPRGQSVQILTNISLYNVLVWPLAFGASIHIVILFVRYWRMPKSYLRQQILILLVFTGLGVVPGQILIWYPWLFFNNSILPWGISNIMLTFIPIGYAFVIYRRSYLQLDIFVTNTLTFLLLFTFWLMAQAIYAHFLRDLDLFQSTATPSGLLLTLLLLILLYINQPTRRGVQSLLYGFQKPYQQKLSQIASHLSATDPQMDALRHVFHEAIELLQVRQAALMLTDNGNMLICRTCLQTEEIPSSNSEFVNIDTKSATTLSLSR